MCGIAGVVLQAGDLDVDLFTRRVAAMTEQVAHRGPDGAGVRIVGQAGLGHRRLAVIDLHERSAQPMALADGSAWVTFNGEIYNFRELRETLRARGCVFRTGSDTEVLLHGYREWGARVVTELRGAFAFAIWDARECQLFLARDRFGKKPLFYSQQPEGFFFASEIKSLLAWPGFPRRPDLEVVHDYLSFGYSLGPTSAFKGVSSLPPAHTMRVRAGRPPELARYWQLAAVDPSNASRSTDDLAHELLERLDDAIRCRLIADVPVGVFLSGGVDSSAIVARAARLASGPLQTFSVGFAEEGYDETAHAREVAEAFGTTHRAFRLNHDLVRELPRLVWHLGEPYADSSLLATWALSREARQHVTVALSGDGADELWLGYPRYAKFRDAVAQFRDGREPRLPFRPLLGPGQPQRVRDHYLRRVEKFREENKQAGYGSALADQLAVSSADRLGLSLERATADDAIDLAARVDVETYLLGDLLPKVDIATMAVGLENRSPFLDHPLADFAASLPQGRRVFERSGALELKALLKHALTPQLPSRLLHRPKQGFAVPVQHWMRHEIRDAVHDLLSGARFRQRELVTPAYVEHLVAGDRSGRENHGTRLWALLCLELWFRTFVDREAAGPLDWDTLLPRPIASAGSAPR